MATRSAPPSAGGCPVGGTSPSRRRHPRRGLPCRPLGARGAVRRVALMSATTTDLILPSLGGVRCGEGYRPCAGGTRDVVCRGVRGAVRHIALLSAVTADLVLRAVRRTVPGVSDACR